MQNIILGLFTIIFIFILGNENLAAFKLFEWTEMSSGSFMTFYNFFFSEVICVDRVIVVF